MSTKKELPKVEEQTTALMFPAQNEVAISAMNADMLADAASATGFENVNSADVSIPFIKILQALSPQCRGEGKIPGAVEGDFFNTVTEEVMKDHIILIPCVYQKAFVEWVPREQGGGFVKQHLDSDILTQTKKDDKGHDVLSNGNHIVTTAYHYCLLLKEVEGKLTGMSERVVLSLTSTQLKKSRRWLSQMMSLQIAVGDKKITPPMYSHCYNVTSREESNDFGSWYGFIIGNPTLLQSQALYLDAKKFYKDVTAGIVKTVEPIEPEVAVAAEVAANVADKF